MRTQTVHFSPDLQALCVFPDQSSDLPQAVSAMGLMGKYPVIVLVGDTIDKIHAAVTRQAIQTISGIAQDLGAVVICAGTTMGVMSVIAGIRRQNHHNYPLIGMAPEELVTWPGGPKSTKFLWMGNKRQQLETQACHFILVPVNNPGDESAWIFDAATFLSQGHSAVTILINGGEIARRDVELSLEKGRRVIVVSRTGRLADSLANQPVRNEWITVIPANSEPQIVKAVQGALSAQVTQAVS